MIVEKDLLALSDVAKLCGTSSSNVSNWRSRDAKFPAPYTQTSSGPIWKAEDIVMYLQRKYDDKGDRYDVISVGNLSSKRIAVIGRARGGKSFFTSRFVFDKTGFVKLFCGNSNDKTVCPIYVKISEYITLESYFFHSDFNSIYPGNEENQSLLELNKKISALIDQQYSQDNLDKMREIEDVIKEIREAESKYPKRKNSNTYIDTYQKPSEFCKELLRKCGLGSIEIVDTPGVSGSVEATKIAKSDIYFFLIKPDNSEESETLKKIVMEIKADIATSKAVFLYKKEGFFLTNTKYEYARIATRKDMEPYNGLFNDLKGNIISTDLDVLDPSGHCILFPTMDPDDIILPEELFLEEIQRKIVSAFNPVDESRRDEEFQELITKHGEKAINFVLKLMEGIRPYELFKDGKIYSVEQVVAEKHDRVMTNDNYRFHSDLEKAYDIESSYLYDYFSSFTADEYPEEWQQLIIKYVYRKLINSIRTDRGLGVGAHPWEERPARTMLIEESIFADEVLNNISNQKPESRNEPYKEALKNNNITSASWNYVGCVDNEEAIIKLKIIKECLLNVNVSSRQNMVLCRYIGGLRKIAEYKILIKLGFNHKDCIEKLKHLPF